WKLPPTAASPAGKAHGSRGVDRISVLYSCQRDHSGCHPYQDALPCLGACNLLDDALGRKTIYRRLSSGRTRDLSPAKPALGAGGQLLDLGLLRQRVRSV